MQCLIVQVPARPNVHYLNGVRTSPFNYRWYVQRAIRQHSFITKTKGNRVYHYSVIDLREEN